MAKLNIYAVLIIFYLFIAMQIISGGVQSDVEDSLLPEILCLQNEKLAKIHYYAQDMVGGPNATFYEVARANVSTDALLSFGKIYVVDDRITAGPGGDTAELGKAQGIFTSSDMETIAAAMSYNVVFTSGEYNGSTLSIAGRNEAALKRRQLAVVGGTGVFRYTRGHAVISTHSNGAGEDSVYNVLEYTIYATFCL